MRLISTLSFVTLVALAGLPLAQAAPAPSGGPPSPTSAPHAILIDAESGAVLFERGGDDMVAPASLAKLMTVEVVFDQLNLGNIKLDEEFVVSENAWRKGGAPSHGSTMYAAIYSKVQVQDLLQGVIIQSANDGCITLAEGIAGNEASFARMMNDRAREIGLEKSNFTNSTGLPDREQRVTVRELAQLARHVIRTYPEYYRWYSEKEFTWNKIRQQNRNPLLAMNIGADGMKTGYTEEAGYNLIGSAIQNGTRLIVVVTGLKTPKERADEAKKLLEWGFRSFESRILFAEGQIVAEAKVYGGAKGRVPLTGDGMISMMMLRNTSDRIIARVRYVGPVRAPVKQGQQIGKLQVWRNDMKVLDTPLRAAADVEIGSMTQRAFDAATELVINLFRAGAERL